jgi:hypothetical protein
MFVLETVMKIDEDEPPTTVHWPKISKGGLGEKFPAILSLVPVDFTGEKKWHFSSLGSMAILPLVSPFLGKKNRSGVRS